MSKQLDEVLGNNQSKNGRVVQKLGKWPKREDVEVWSPKGQDHDVNLDDGEPLVRLRRGAIERQTALKAFPFLYEQRKHTTNTRQEFSGGSYREIKSDGTLSKFTKGNNVPSATLGFMCPDGRFNYCRPCFSNRDNPAGFQTLIPLLQEAAEVFKQTCPQQYAEQMEQAAKIPDWVIPGTPFTTITVNNTYAGALHYDGANLLGAYAVMIVLRKGFYEGGEFVLADRKIGVDLHDRDVIVMRNRDELHGVIPFKNGIGKKGKDWCRISIVCYFRGGMLDCGTAAEELQKAKMQRGGAL